VNIQPGKWLVVKGRMPHSADTFEVGRTSLEYIFHPTYTSWFVTHNDVYAVFDTRSQARALADRINAIRAEIVAAERRIEDLVREYRR